MPDRAKDLICDICGKRWVTRSLAEWCEMKCLGLLDEEEDE